MENETIFIKRIDINNHDLFRMEEDVSDTNTSQEWIPEAAAEAVNTIIDYVADVNEAMLILNESNCDNMSESTISQDPSESLNEAITKLVEEKMEEAKVEEFILKDLMDEIEATEGKIEDDVS
jgi:tetrahydromethanopterin S-methyltransferase subunit H